MNISVKLAMFIAIKRAITLPDGNSQVCMRKKMNPYCMYELMAKNLHVKRKIITEIQKVLFYFLKT